MYLYQLSEIQVIAFSLVFLRILSFFISVPVFSMASVPVQVKLLVSLVITVLLYPVVDFSHLTADVLQLNLAFYAIREILIGLALGYLTRMFFFAVSIMGQIVSLSMGLANAQIFNPALGAQSATVEQFQSAIVTLFFFAINGHHYFLRGLSDSFTLVPINASFFSTQSMTTVFQLTGEIIAIGIQLSVPVLLAILVMNVAMGIVGRAVPQINVLITSLPINVLLGFLVMIVSLPLFLEEAGQTLELVTIRLFEFMKVI